MMRTLLLLAVAAATVPLRSQDIKIPVNLDRLAAHAKETVNVTLDSSTLKLASKFLSDNDRDEAQVKKLVSKVKSIQVRCFEFDKDGQYSKGDIDEIRGQLRGPAWARIVDMKSNDGESSEVYLKKNGDQIGGLVVIAAEPRELTIVHIDGAIDPEELSELGGHMGIPNVYLDANGRGNGKSEKKSGTSKSKPKDDE